MKPKYKSIVDVKPGSPLAIERNDNRLFWTVMVHFEDCTPEELENCPEYRGEFPTKEEAKAYGDTFPEIPTYREYFDKEAKERQEREWNERLDRFPEANNSLSHEIYVEPCAKLAIFEANGQKYAWSQDGQFPEEFEHGYTHLDRLTAGDGDSAFWFAIADCAFPPFFLVFGSSFEDAYEEFCDTFSRLMAIDGEDLKDYDEDSLNYSASGVPIDTESIQGGELRLVRADF